MNKFLVIILFAIVAAVPAFAQKKDHETMRKELMEFKLKYLAQEMDLQEDQQKKFFELYNQMSDEKAKLFKETKSLEKKLKDSPDASDAEYESVSMAITASKEKDAAIEKKYDEQFKKFLTAKQIFKMKSAEERFRQKMNEIRHNRKRKK